MINIRYHIVSLVAVFLALAVGIFTGSTLLDRATVDYLKASRDRVDARNAELKAENEEWRSAAESVDSVETAFAADALGELIEGRLAERVVLTIANRGIDEATVDQLHALLVRGGAESLGVVWLDDRTDLTDLEAMENVERFVNDGDALDPQAPPGGSAPNRTSAQAFLDRLAVGLGPLVTPAAPAVTTTAVVDPAAPTTLEATAPEAPVRQEPTLLADLVDASFVDWDDPSGRLDAPPQLPDQEVTLVVLSGEGASVPATSTTDPLVERLASVGARAVYGEVLRPRTLTQVVAAEPLPDRGAIVDELRSNDDVSSAVATVDNVDRPLGVTALLLVIAGPAGPVSGKFGEAPSADQPFPSSE